MTPRHLVLGFLASGCLVALVGCGDNSTGTNDNNNNANTPVCGNGAQEGAEECDGVDLAGETCQSQGLPGGTLACYGNCTFDRTSCDPPVTCGNGAVDPPQEQCDGSLLNGQTCVTLGYASGTLTCAANCQFNESLCETGPLCGDGIVDAGEQCDGVNLNSQTCITRGYASGTLSCSTTTCQFDESQCVPDEDCGNGNIDTGEQCDGSNLNSQTCETQGFDGGTLNCTGGCLFDRTSCFDCGDGVRNGTEECDTADFGTATCNTEASHTGGTLTCTASCTIDSSSCYTCGDTQLDGPEVCDGNNVNSETCQTQASLAEGTLACASSCLAYDTSDCHDCGNGTREGPEACDTADFGTATCQTEASLTDGNLTCLGDCTIVTSDCYECGNSTIEGPEICDTNNVGSETCQTQAGAADGTLTCDVGCMSYDTSDCHECGNGIIEGNEECDGDQYTDSCISLGYGTGAIGCNSSCLLDTSACVTCTWQWSPLPISTGVPMATAYHEAVWMPQYGKMFVYGGWPSHYSYGSMYDPVADDWEMTTFIGNGFNTPASVWSGTAILTWAGGGWSYDPFTDTADAFAPDVDEPFVGQDHTAVWTGTEMIVWGGGSGTNYGARYNPITDTWTPTSQGTDCPFGRTEHAAVWTGSEMIVWGGGPAIGTDTGGRYNPTTDTWEPTTTGANCPVGRAGIYRAAVWTGSRMIIWGGARNASLDTGGQYDPVTDAWETTSTGTNLPHSRWDHTAVWTGSEMIVWGGEYYSAPNYIQLNDGGHYDPVTDTWRHTDSFNSPQARFLHTAIWTGNEMIIWGGAYDSGGGPAYLQNGGRYWCGP